MQAPVPVPVSQSWFGIHSAGFGHAVEVIRELVLFFAHLYSIYTYVEPWHRLSKELIVSLLQPCTA